MKYVDEMSFDERVDWGSQQVLTSILDSGGTGIRSAVSRISMVNTQAGYNKALEDVADYICKVHSTYDLSEILDMLKGMKK